ncbi:hypothetical protein DFS34DRAFT_595903 [Phlyctochytrium arcticum]|nr:hypothetical protein DFS34DRAFT_595903 [Phlyctochytrium arcticum]
MSQTSQSLDSPEEEDGTRHTSLITRTRQRFGTLVRISTGLIKRARETVWPVIQSASTVTESSSTCLIWSDGLDRLPCPPSTNSRIGPFMRLAHYAASSTMWKTISRKLNCRCYCTYHSCNSFPNHMFGNLSGMLCRKEARVYTSATTYNMRTPSLALEMSRGTSDFDLETRALLQQNLGEHDDLWEYWSKQTFKEASIPQLDECVENLKTISSGFTKTDSPKTNNLSLTHLYFHQPAGGVPSLHWNLQSSYHSSCHHHDCLF